MKQAKRVERARQAKAKFDLPIHGEEQFVFDFDDKLADRMDYRGSFYNFVQSVLDSPEGCQTCGGLAPELVLVFSDAACILSATLVLDYKKKRGAKTDYNKLADYLLLSGYGSMEVIEEALQKRAKKAEESTVQS